MVEGKKLVRPSSPSTNILVMVVHACNPSYSGGLYGKIKIYGQPWANKRDPV
jgi:hypothetical protein